MTVSWEEPHRGIDPWGHNVKAYWMTPKQLYNILQGSAKEWSWCILCHFPDKSYYRYREKYG